LRFRASSGEWSALGTGGPFGFGGTNDVLLPLADNSVIVGGTFTAFGAGPVNRIARFSSATNQWSDLGSGINSGGVTALARLNDGTVVVGGDSFSTAGGVPAPATNSPTTLTIPSAQPGDAGVYTASVESPCGTTHSSPATLTISPPACPADFDGNGLLNPDDLSDFITSYFTGC
jgi:hypothetical protein